MALLGLGRDWKEKLARLVHSANRELLISSPYVTSEGTDLVIENLSSEIRRNGKLRMLTNLSPLNICHGATDPRALQSLMETTMDVRIVHLPRLHAKVYVADSSSAIVTSANLTGGGLTLNFEYGIEVNEPGVVETVREDVASYSELGADISPRRLTTYCQIAHRARSVYHRQQVSTTKSVQAEFSRLLRTAEDELVRLRLGGEAVHTVFAKTILYLLKLHGRLSTPKLHRMIETIHPDLCDNTVDRVIDGKRFGKKWKHAVRTAQQQLKKRGLVSLTGGQWAVADR